MEALRVRELERQLPRMDLDEAQRSAVEALTRSLVNKILHAPVSRLRREAEREEGMAYLEAARVLFDLDDGDPDRGDPDHGDPDHGDPDDGDPGRGDPDGVAEAANESRPPPSEPTDPE